MANPSETHRPQITDVSLVNEDENYPLLKRRKVFRIMFIIGFPLAIIAGYIAGADGSMTSLRTMFLIMIIGFSPLLFVAGIDLQVHEGLYGIGLATLLVCSGVTIALGFVVLPQIVLMDALTFSGSRTIFQAACVFFLIWAPMELARYKYRRTKRIRWLLTGVILFSLTILPLVVTIGMEL